jgi:FMN phosphatase YigB (HAD superfamily)
MAKVEARDEQGFYAQTIGREINRVLEKPSLYIQPSPDTLDILKRLRKEGKMTFLTSNSSFEYVDVAMKTSIGNDWKDYFDLIIINARKPLFQRAETPFYEYDPKTKSKRG